MSRYKIIEAVSNSDIKDFIKVPFDIYRNNSSWVPQLISESRKLLDKKANPFFLHSQATYFLAKKDGRPVARIAGIINNRHNEFHEEKTGFFGFFDCPNDSALAAELFETASNYARAAGMAKIMGPANFSSNDDWGFLTDAFDKPPVFMMPYNPQYYLDLAEKAGFVKAKDLIAYYIDDKTQIPDKAIRIAEMVRRKHNIEVRKIDLDNFDNELVTVREIYNNAWSKNWGFVPMTEEEINHTAGDFKKILDPDIVFFAFVNGKPAGFSLALPDLNIVFKKMNGRLLPLGLFKFLWHTKIRRSIDGARIMAMGVVHEFRRLGIDNIFYLDTYRHGVKKGYRWGELSWILEDNVLMNKALLMIGAVPYKRYRLYEKKL